MGRHILARGGSPWNHEKSGRPRRGDIGLADLEARDARAKTAKRAANTEYSILNADFRDAEFGDTFLLKPGEFWGVFRMSVIRFASRIGFGC